MHDELFRKVAAIAADYFEALPSLPVRARDGGAPPELDAALPESGEAPEVAIDRLVAGVEPALVHSGHPRYFGFVIGGATPAAIAADWLASAWDQNAQAYRSSPAAAMVEDVVARWVLELLGLPAGSGVGFVTGAQMANFTALCVARDEVLRKAGWEVEEYGLQGAPRVKVLCGERCHGTIRSAITMIGLGEANVRPIAADRQGRMRLENLEAALDACRGEPTIVCVQAGNVNTGAFDPLRGAIGTAKGRGAWVHVDGAFGLWARSSQVYAGLADGVEGADSWATDAHKWLNVPYDSGIVIIKDRDAHRRLKTGRCSYAGAAEEGRRDGSVWAPENSRRARAFVLYAALRNLGRAGLRGIVENGCAMARRAARALAEVPGLRVLNEVVLNQVLFRADLGGDDDAANERIAARVQAEGVCWLGAAEWEGRVALRLSVSNWATTERDIDLSAESIARAVATETATGAGALKGE